MANRPVEIDIGLAAIAPPKDGLRRVRALRASETGFDRAVFRQLCGFGWLGLRLPEPAGGAGLGPRALCAVAKALGGALCPEPLIAASLAARLLPEALRTPVLAGDMVVLPAWREAPGGLDPAGETVLRDGRLFGRKRGVAMARGADAFLVLLADGLALVAHDAPGLRLEAESAPGWGSPPAALIFDGAPAEIVTQDIAPGEIPQALDEAILADCAYVLGLAERAFALAGPVGRPAFPPVPAPPTLPGAPAATDRRFADMRRDLDLARSTIDGAADRLETDIDPTQRAALVSRAALRAASTGFAVPRMAAQVHGGLGMTELTDVGLCHLVAQALVPHLGNGAAHRARITRAAGSGASD